MGPRIPCRAVFLDAGGVIVLPNRDLVAGALARVGIEIDGRAVAVAHYRAVRALDRAASPTVSPVYLRALSTQLGIVGGRTGEALRALEHLADRDRSGEILWSEPTPGAVRTIDGLQRAGIAVVIVTNSDGHGEENLRDCGFDVPVIDSTVVGAAKPDARIFEVALSRAGVAPDEVVHVGDTLATDIAGAHAAGIAPIHFDPTRACRATDHRHIRSLPGIWQHLRAPTRAPTRTST